ncbi:VOC family protein [Singulisphaera rosea]
MAVQPIPSGYHSLTPYLIVEGASELIAFLQQAFGATEVFRMTRPDGKVAHAEVKVGDSMLMISESRAEWPPMPSGLYVYVDDTDATYRSAIEAGAESVMEPADQFYGDRNAGIRDKSGNLWWIATHIKDVSHGELMEAAQAQGKA